MPHVWQISGFLEVVEEVTGGTAESVVCSAVKLLRHFLAAFTASMPPPTTAATVTAAGSIESFIFQCSPCLWSTQVKKYKENNRVSNITVGNFVLG